MAEKARSDFRVNGQPAFVLHTYPWKETSLIVEFFTRDFGRMSLVARGAKRPMSQYRGLLNPFCPLAISYSGKGEIKNLIRAEWYGTIPLGEKFLMSAFYINELLVRLLPRGVPEPALFKSYYETLKKLASGEEPLVTLRYFELDFLNALGYGLPEGPFPASRYRFVMGDLIASDNTALENAGVSSDTLRALISRTLQPGEQEREARMLTRDLIGYYLEEFPLNTRRILNELKKI